jgi:5'-3' exonuclease
MSIFSKLAGRSTVDPVAGTETTEAYKNEEAGNTTSGSDSDSLDLVDKNEKAILEHPNEITTDAQHGVQKAEGVALVWSKKTVYCIYAW